MSAQPTTKTKIFKIRLRKDDTVIVLAGKYKGQTGKITAVHPKENKVTVAGINIITKHIKPNQQYPQGTILKIEKPIWVSKVGIVEPTTKKASRVQYKVAEDGTKSRVFQRTGKEIK